MPARSEREVLVEYATRDEETLSLALSIVEAHADICTRVIAEFIAAVASRLTELLGDAWIIAQGHTSAYNEQYAQLLTMQYRAHPGRFLVRLDSHQADYPKQVYFAVSSESGQEHHKAVKAQLDRIAVGKVSYSFWYRYLDDRHSWWGSAKTAPWLLQKRESVEYVVNYMEKLARAVEKGLSVPDSE